MTYTEAKRRVSELTRDLNATHEELEAAVQAARSLAPDADLHAWDEYLSILEGGKIIRTKEL